MNSHTYLERRTTQIATLDRDQLKKRIRSFRGPFPMDFTEDYLDAVSVDRLRHILLAAVIVSKASRH